MPDRAKPALAFTPRPSTSRRSAAALVAMIALVALSGCTFVHAKPNTPQPQRGGTLFVNLATPGGFDSLDPQRGYSASAANVDRLFARTLTTYRTDPGSTGVQIVSDLATDTGRPSQNNTVWKFTLKPNVKWQGGELVTCAQVKYGVERRFSDLADSDTGQAVFSTGPTYPMDYLQDNQDQPYRGPYLDNDNNGKGLESIQCEDQRTIVFHLSRPVSDFGYAVALSVFAPVLPAKDTKEHYQDQPYSNGPYQFASRTATEIDMVRNPFWSDSNDKVRKAYPDKIVFKLRADDDGAVTNDLIQDQGDARNTVMLDSSVAPNFLQQVINDPNLDARAVGGTTTSLRFMAINTTTIPNLACRQALIYAFDKRKWRSVDGGSAVGDYATTVIPPGVTGHKDFDLYDSLNNPEGNPDKAISIMQEQTQQGHACRSTIQAAYIDTSLNRRLMATVVEAYQLAGIQVVLHPFTDFGAYYNDGIGDPANKLDLMVFGWVPDWTSGSAIIPALFDGRHIPKLNPKTGHGSGNIDVSMLNDPKINQEIDQALGEADADREAALWGDLDQKIQAEAVAIPIIFDRAISMAGSNVLGGFINPAFSEPDISALGLANP
jgi:peptide/nickel transport system substrate-binding protein